MAGDELGVPLSDVKVIEGDTTIVPYGWGTWGSRSAVTGGGSVSIASGKVREKIVRVASHFAEVPERDLELADSIVRRKADGAALVPIREIAFLSRRATFRKAKSEDWRQQPTTSPQP